ncbi:MAG: cytochrome C oxidase subunit II [Cyanobacteria bacterium SW_11_48_12]|nr:MAG: cytochrome C oxidase subunit II [Cyanobacteria bacterium SW_11_48_12]
MLRILEYIVLAIGAAAIIVVSYWLGQQAYSWMPVEASTDAERIDDLFSFLVWLSSIIFFGVIGMIVYAIIFDRAAQKDYSEGHSTRGNAKIEALWTGVPVLLVLWISVYSFDIYQQMDIEGPIQVLGELPAGAEPVDAAPASNGFQPVVEIEVFARQWDWTFRYPKRNVTSRELHLPVNRRIRLVLHAEDVLHGFYVPAFRIKQDIIPNRPIDFQLLPTRVGKYQLQDSQLSGTYFALMQADVYVDSPQDYTQWLAEANTRSEGIANRAATEHAQPTKRIFKSNWDTVSPVQSPVVSPSN